MSRLISYLLTVKNIFGFLEPGVDLETITTIPVLMSWASRMISNLADRIIIFHYGSSSYVPFHDPRRLAKDYPWGFNVERFFTDLMGNTTSKFKLKDIPMSGDLLVEGCDEDDGWWQEGMKLVDPSLPEITCKREDGYILLFYFPFSIVCIVCCHLLVGWHSLAMTNFRFCFCSWRSR